MTAEREWNDAWNGENGASIPILARHYAKRQLAAYGATATDDALAVIVTDATGAAWIRWSNWRANHVPRKAIATIVRAVRFAVQRATADYLHSLTAVSGDPLGYLVPSDDDDEIGDALTIIGKLPYNLRPVALMLARGLNQREAAEELDIAQPTVSAHVAKIREWIKATN